MTENENRNNLLKSPVFRDLPGHGLDRLAGNVQYRVFQPGEVIFRQGEAAGALYIIVSGKVRVFVSHESGLERELAILGPGDNFGEVALLTGEPRTANVEAVDEVNLMALAKDDFDRLLRECPDLSRKFMREMRTWLLKDQEIIKEETDQVIKASRLKWYDFLLVVGISILLAVSFNQSNPNGIPLLPAAPDRSSVLAIGAPAALDIYQRGQALVIDAMPSNFYQKRHIKGAVNMPMALFDIVYLMTFSEENKEREILVYGNTISRPYDLEIAAKLQLLGYTGVKIIDGGLPAWEAMGYPVEEGAGK